MVAYCRHKQDESRRMGLILTSATTWEDNCKHPQVEKQCHEHSRFDNEVSGSAQQFVHTSICQAHLPGLRGSRVCNFMYCSHSNDCIADWEPGCCAASQRQQPFLPKFRKEKKKEKSTPLGVVTGASVPRSSPRLLPSNIYHGTVMRH